MSELPQGWAEAKFADVANQRSGNSKLIKGKLENQAREGLYPAYSASGQDVWRDTFEYEGDAIIVSAVGARCGKAFRANGKWSAVANTHIVRPEPEIVDADFLFLFLNDENFWEKGGSAQPFVKVRATFERSIDLPPLPEQRRIVAKIDSLTGKSRHARDHLDHIPRLVEKYEQAILASAFRGDLTREMNGSDSPSCDATGIDSRVIELETLPSGWAWTSIGAIGQVTGGLTKNASRKSMPKQVPYLRVANVYANELRLADVASIGCTEAEYHRTALRSGDLLVVEGNGSLDQIGRVALWTGEVPGCSHQNHLIRVSLGGDVAPKFALYWLLSPGGRAAIETIASSSSGLHTLSISKVRGLPIPVCSGPQQTEIVRRIESAFTWIDRLATDATSARKLIDRLDQSILAKAFRGELVPQDSADEPASVLLDRIRAERVDAPKPKRGRRKTT